MRNYDEDQTLYAKSFYKKKFIGTIAGLDFKYKSGNISWIGIAYSRSVNKKRINYQNVFPSYYIGLVDFNLTHVNNFFQIYYQRCFTKKNLNFKYEAGVVYARMNQQEIDIDPRAVIIEERNYKTNRLEEAGFFWGIAWSKKVDTYFDFGFKSRIYYLISVNQLEAVTLTSSLTYHF